MSSALPPFPDSRIKETGAVDQVAEVFLNGCLLGKHEGGYLPFTFDVTEYISEETNRIDVKVKDTLSARYPYGKQRRARGGMWYTPVSGIWQSVWMECVPWVYISGLKIETDTQKVRITVKRGGAGGRAEAEAAAEHTAKTKDTAEHTAKTKVAAEHTANIKAAAEHSAKTETAAEHSAKTKTGITVTIRLHDGTMYRLQADGTEAEINLAAIRLADGKLYQPVLWSTEHPYLYEISVLRSGILCGFRPLSSPPRF